MHIPPLIELLASWLGAVGLIWSLFERTEKILTEDARRSLADWLKNVRPEPGSQAWLKIFKGILDRVFGTEYLSWKTFARSCVASLITLALMWGLYLLKSDAPPAGLPASPLLILIWLLATFFVDYVSFCESRGAISMMGNVGTGGVVLLLIGDFILTTFIFVTGASFALVSVQDVGGAQEIVKIVNASVEDPRFRLDPENPATIQQIQAVMALSRGVAYAIDFTVSGLPFWRAGGASTTALFGIFFCSTFITSAWVWLYALGGSVIKAAQYLGFGTAKLKRWLDIEKQPMLSIGYVCMMLVTLGFVLILIF